MSKHTSGPLAVGFYRPTEAFRAIAEHVAVMRTSDQGLVAICGPSGDPASESDARLFAAAPDLFEALEALAFAARFLMPRGATWAELLATCRVALAKARGEERS